MFISATIHTPAASVYANYASSARKESFLIPGFFLAGLIAAAMPLVAGFIGILTMTAYGPESGLSSYLNIAQLAIDSGPILGGIALAAVLAAVISSGAPILLASATMLVNDWIPGSKHYSSDKKLLAYKLVTVVYGVVAALIAWLGNKKIFEVYGPNFTIGDGYTFKWGFYSCLLYTSPSPRDS